MYNEEKQQKKQSLFFMNNTIKLTAVKSWPEILIASKQINKNFHEYMNKLTLERPGGSTPHHPPPPLPVKWGRGLVGVPPTIPLPHSP